MDTEIKIAIRMRTLKFDNFLFLFNSYLLPQKPLFCRHSSKLLQQNLQVYVKFTKQCIFNAYTNFNPLFHVVY